MNLLLQQHLVPREVRSTDDVDFVSDWNRPGSRFHCCWVWNVSWCHQNRCPSDLDLTPLLEHNFDLAKSAGAASSN